MQVSLSRHRFLYLDVGDPVDRFTRSGPKRMYLAANQSFGRGIMVNLVGLDVPPEQVRAALLAREITTTVPPAP